jgi:hypothetical protein
MQMVGGYDLGSVERADGTVWYTLVFESPTSCCVFRYDDSPALFLKERTEIIHMDDFDKHEVNGIPLSKLVEEKLKALTLLGKPGTNPPHTRPPGP